VALNHAMNAIDVPGEIIVVDNNSSDRTPQIAGENGARVVFEPVNQISRARNAGARAAAGRYLFFLDADTLPTKKLMKTALNFLDTGTCCGGGVRVSSNEAIPVVARFALAFWNRIAVSFRLAAGCFIFCLRRSFEDIGGFSEKVYAGEEILFSRGLAKWGKKRGLSFRIITDPSVATSLRKLKWFTPLQLIQMVLLVCFPVALRFRPMCSFWYKRPANSKTEFKRLEK
ncbi:glycosyltransferase, partial [Thermodesulfobacteriota bacterium]